jgi:hypothetical protein
MTTRTALSKQRPWPYDAYIQSIPVILKPGKDDNLVGRKSKTLDATAPTTYDYGSQSPYKERTARFRDLSGGMGLGRETLDPINRYNYAQRMDLSVNGKWILGPRFETHIETVNAGAGAVRQIIQALHGGVLTVFAICDNGVYRRTADGTWVASLTAATTPALPGGQLPRVAVRFKGRYVAAIDALYLGVSNGNIWQYTGAAWIQAGAAAGPGDGASNGEARYVAKVRDELWIAGDNWVVKTVSDPLLRASYAGVIWIGDQSSKISWIVDLGDTLYIFKDNGHIYTVDTAGNDIDLFPTIGGATSLYNGRNAASWLDRLWAPLGDTLIILDKQANLTTDGLDKLLDNTSPVRGKFVAGAGHNAWFMYEIYYNERLNTSYLVKHGSWVADNDARTTSADQKFLDVHHGAIAEWNKEATSLQVVHNIHSTANDRLYVGFSDGTLAWCVLPLNTMDPTQDTACEFTGLTSYLYLPDHHAKFEADNKLWQGASVFGSYLGPNEYAQIEYKIYQDSLSAWTVLANTTTTSYTYSGQRLDFPSDNPVYSKILSLRVGLYKNPDLSISPANISPVLEGIGVHESVRPSLSIEWTLNINASSFNAKRDGTMDRRRGSLIRDSLIELSRQIRNIQITFPSGSVEDVAILDYNESWRSRPGIRDLEWTIQMTFVQVATLTENIVAEGLTYNSLEPYTLDQLEAII